jgi:hypothetical protein
MPEPMRKVLPEQSPDKSSLELEGFEKFFDVESDKNVPAGGATAIGDASIQAQIEKLVGRLSDLVTLSVDQRVETSRITNQLIENQRQLVATQQILIRLMERSIELTRHVAAIEEKLPAVFELPGTVDNLRARLALLEGIEIA